MARTHVRASSITPEAREGLISVSESDGIAAAPVLRNRHGHGGCASVGVCAIFPRAQYGSDSCPTSSRTFQLKSAVFASPWNCKHCVPVYVDFNLDLRL